LLFTARLRQTFGEVVVPTASKELHLPFPLKTALCSPSTHD